MVCNHKFQQSGIFVPLLLQSLFCWQGADNRLRFIVITLLVHLFFILFTLIFSGSLVIGFIILLLSTAVVTCTNKRRLTDAHLKKNWLIIPSAIFLVTGLAIIIIDSSVSYWLCLLPLVISSLLLTYPSYQSATYHYGYHGPIDFSQSTGTINRRIEPSLIGSAQTHIDINSTHQPDPSTPYTNREFINDDTSYQTKKAGNTSPNIGELIKEKLLNGKHAIITITMLVAVILVSIIINLWSEDHIEQPLVEHTSLPLKPVPQARKNMITLPDEFALLTTHYDGLVINWQADEVDTAEIWNIQKANGDKSCSVITFNNGQTMRTTKVDVENGDDYFAEFSPLDTHTIVKNIAARNRFTLCGYSFSLKGSQASLVKHSYYSEILLN